MKITTLSLLVLVSLNFVFCQDFTGKWTGLLRQDPGAYSEKYYFEMELLQKGNKIEGQSSIFINQFFGKMEVRGEIQGDTLLFEELRMIDEQMETGYEWCLKKGMLILEKGDVKAYLKGDWSGEISVGPCEPGTIEVSRITSDSIQKLMERGYVNTEFQNGMLKQVQFREVKSISDVIIRNDLFQIFLSDNLQADNDVVSLIFNEKKVIGSYKLKKEPIALKLNYEKRKKYNYLVVHAEKLGKFPPAAATVIIDDGISKQQFVLESDLNRSALLRIKYQPVKNK